MQLMRLGLEFILSIAKTCVECCDVQRRPVWTLNTGYCHFLSWSHASPTDYWWFWARCMNMALLIILNSWLFHSVILMTIYTVITNIINRETHKICLCDTRSRNQAIPSDSPWWNQIRVHQRHLWCADRMAYLPAASLPDYQSVSIVEAYRLADWLPISMFKRNGDH